MSNKGLGILECPSIDLKLAGRDVTATAIKVGQIPAVIRCLEGVEIRQDDEGNSDVMTLIADHGEQIIEAVAMLTGLEKQLVAEADIAEMSEYLQKWLELNADFFRQRVLPIYLPLASKVLDLVGRALQAANGAGLTSSSS